MFHFSITVDSYFSTLPKLFATSAYTGLQFCGSVGALLLCSFFFCLVSYVNLHKNGGDNYRFLDFMHELVSIRHN